MKKTLLSILFLTVSVLLLGQQRVDGSFPFQNDPAKKFSLYIPSNYNAANPNKMMVGLHPFNTNRWDAKSWCDTLIVFAETNNLLLICPDGGLDGQVNDPIDTAFTSLIIDSMLSWYNVEEDKIYLMGFSWGGLTTYTYGLSHHNRFGGFMPIGAAINGASGLSGIIQNSSGMPWYLVHGGNDAPGTRFTPLLSALQNNNAITNSILMPGVGHTIDFPNRNSILTEAYIWIDSVNCAGINTSVIEGIEKSGIKLFPNIIETGQSMGLLYSGENSSQNRVIIYDRNGMPVYRITRILEKGPNTLNIPLLNQGLYFLTVEGEENKSVHKFYIH